MQVLRVKDIKRVPSAAKVHLDDTDYCYVTVQLVYMIIIFEIDTCSKAYNHIKPLAKNCYHRGPVKYADVYFSYDYIPRSKPLGVLLPLNLVEILGLYPNIQCLLDWIISMSTSGPRLWIEDEIHIKVHLCYFKIENACSFRQTVYYLSR
jgi:hypothetical protein